MAEERFDDDLKKKPAHDYSYISASTKIKLEPVNVEAEGCPATKSFRCNTTSGPSPVDYCKDENDSDQWVENPSRVIGSSHPPTYTKQELDIGPTEFQPPDSQFTLQLKKRDSNKHQPLWIGENVCRGPDLRRLDGTESTQHQSPTGHHGDFVQESKHYTAVSRELGSPRRNSNTKSAELHQNTANPDLSKQLSLTSMLLNISDISSHLFPENLRVHQRNAACLKFKNKSHYVGVAKKFECDHCIKKFTCKSNLLTHMHFHNTILKHDDYSNVSNELYECDSCHKIFNLKSKLRLHMQEHSIENFFQCKVCNTIFWKNSDYFQHMSVHVIPFQQCSISDVKYSPRTSCRARTQIHIKKRPFLCKVCNKEFSQQKHLARHSRLHSKDIPFQCKECYRKFSRFDVLLKHSRVHTKNRRHQCKVCNKLFNENYSMVVHMRVHTNERPYPCTKCDRKFSESSSLNKHIRVHTKERPYQCSFCKKRFSQTSTYNKHVRLHTKEQPYLCTKCDERFTRSDTLARHMRVHT